MAAVLVHCTVSTWRSGALMSLGRPMLVLPLSSCSTLEQCFVSLRTALASEGQGTSSKYSEIKKNKQSLYFKTFHFSFISAVPCHSKFTLDRNTTRIRVGNIIVYCAQLY